MIKHTAENLKIEAAKNKVINTILLAVVYLSFIGMGLTAFRTIKYGFDFSYFIQLFFTIVIFFIGIYRNRISLLLKVIFLMTITAIVFISGVSKYGFLVSSKVYIILNGAFLLTILPFRKSIIGTTLLLVVYLCFGYLFTQGILHYPSSIESYATNYAAWIMDAFILFIVSFCIMFYIKYYGESLLDSIQNLEKSNRELKNRERKYRSLFECSNDAILLYKDGIVFDCNAKSLELFETKRDYVIGVPPTALSPEFQPCGKNSTEKAKEILDTLTASSPLMFEWQCLKMNGEIFDAQINLNLIDIHNETYVQFVVRDITEQKKVYDELEKSRDNLEKMVKDRTFELEATNEEIKATNEELYGQRERLEETINKLHKTQNQLIDAEKMATIGILTSGVAHEINNPLNFIQTGAYSLQNAIEDIEDGNSSMQLINKQKIALKHIEEGINRITDITKSLNHFNRNVDGEYEKCDIHIILNNCLRILNNNIKYKTEVTKEYANDDVTLTANEGKLHQLFINIINNANQAIKKSGKIVISTYHLNQFIVIKISDNGEGIPPENIARLYDPFFTTKEAGEGTGLGLFIVYSIIEEHKGHIDVESEKGIGTTFTISLPVNH